MVSVLSDLLVRWPLLRFRDRDGARSRIPAGVSPAAQAVTTASSVYVAGTHVTMRSTSISTSSIDAATGKTIWRIESPVAPVTLSADAGRVAFHDGEKVVCLDRDTGKPKWTSQPVKMRLPLPTAYAPTLVLTDDVVLFAGGEKYIPHRGGQRVQPEPAYRQRLDPPIRARLRHLRHRHRVELQVAEAFDHGLGGPAGPSAAAGFADQMWRGAALFRQGEFEQAAGVFAGYDTADAAFNQGNALVMLGKYEEAIVGYDRSLQLRPGWEPAVANREIAAARLALVEARLAATGY